MKIENFDKVKKLMDKLESLNRDYKRFSEEKLTVGVGYTKSCAGYFFSVEAIMDSENKIADKAGMFVYECRAILSDQIKDLIEEINSL